jgi:glucokinase
MKYLFGIDIGGTTVKMGFFDETHKLLDKWEIKTDTSNNGEKIFADIASSIKNYLDNKNISINDVLGYGIGVPAATENNYIEKCDNLGWENIHVDKEFKKHIPNGLVRVCNDANGAALGEVSSGAASKYNSCVLITLGTGVGCGVIIDKKIVEGKNGSAGEVGHLTMEFEDPFQCNCGKKGCLETFASANGIVRYAKKQLINNTLPTKLDLNQNFNSKDIFDLAKENDEFALKMVNHVCSKIALACSYIACVISPEIILIGGGVSKAGEFLTNTISKYYQEYTYHATRDLKIALATLGNDAGIYGAANLIK